MMFLESADDEETHLKDGLSNFFSLLLILKEEHVSDQKMV